MSIVGTSKPEFATNEIEAETGLRNQDKPSDDLESKNLKVDGEASQSEAKHAPNVKYVSDEPFARFCADGAHIWKQYMDRAKVWDDELANVLNGDLDPLLIFAGLFSAILSAFLIEIRKGLQEDLQDTTNTLLRILIQDHHNLTVIPTSSRFEPTASSRWINGLWFSSLIFSLMSALGASLAKGWVTQYSSTGFGTTWRDASSHRRRFMGMMRWRMKLIIQGLPIFIHIAFFLFAIGLVILLFIDNPAIGGVVLVLIIAITIFYIGSTAHPFYSFDSPFRTPISNIINWSMDRLRPNFEPVSWSTSFVDSDAFKAQTLAWLLTESADGNVVSDAVHAIAGLPMKPSVQAELYQDSVVRILSQGLSECINKLDGSEVLAAYLHATLRLVQVGSGKSEASNDSVRFILASLVSDDGGSLHLTVCNNLQPGVRELALCLNARIRLLVLNEHGDDSFFTMDVPVLLKSNTQPYIRRLLLEVYLLGDGSKADNDISGSKQARNYLEEIKSSNASLRENGHRTLSNKARSDENIMSLVSAHGVEMFFEGLISHSNDIRTDYLATLSTLCSYYAFRKQICEHRGVVEQLDTLLWNEHLANSEESTQELNHPLTRKMEALMNLAWYDNIWKALDGQNKIVEGLKHRSYEMRMKFINSVITYCQDTRFRSEVITAEFIRVIQSYFRDKGYTLWYTTLVLIEGLIIYDDIRPSLLTVDFIVEGILQKNDERFFLSTLVVKLLDFHDVRYSFVTPNVISAFIAILDNRHSHARNLMILGWIRTLVRHNDLRPMLITADLVDAIVASLADHYLKNVTIDIMVYLASDHAIQLNLEIKYDIITYLFTLLEDSFIYGDLRDPIAKIILSLAQCDDIRPRFLTTENMLRIVSSIENKNQKSYILAIEVLRQLSNHDDILLHLVTPGLIRVVRKVLPDRLIAEGTLIGLVENLSKHEEARSELMTRSYIEMLYSNADPFTFASPLSIAFPKLAMYDDVRSRLVEFYTETIVEDLDSRSIRVQFNAIEAIYLLMMTDIVQPVLLKERCISAIIAALDSENANTYHVAVKVVWELAKHAEIRSRISTENTTCAMIAMLRERQLSAQPLAIADLGDSTTDDNAQSEIPEDYVADAMIRMLKKDWTVGEKVVSLSFLRLMENDDIQSQLVTEPFIFAILSALENADTDTQRIVSEVIHQLIRHYQTSSWPRLVTHLSPFINKMITILRDGGLIAREVVIIVIQVLAQDSDLQLKLGTDNVINALMALLTERALTKPDDSTYRIKTRRIRTLAVTERARTKPDDSTYRIETRIIRTLAALAQHSHIRSKILNKTIFKSWATVLRDSSTPVGKDLLNTIVNLVNYDDTRMTLLTLAVSELLPDIIDNSSDVSYAIKIIHKLSKHDDVRSKLATAELIEALAQTWATKGNHDRAFHLQASEVIEGLVKNDEIPSELLTDTFLNAIIAALQHKNPDVRWTTTIIIQELARHGHLRSNIVAKSLSGTIAKNLMWNDSKAALELLAALEKHDDLHASLFPPSVIDTLVDVLRIHKPHIEEDCVKVLPIFLFYSATSDTNGVFNFLRNLLEDKDPWMVQVSLPALSYLAKRENWRACLCQSFKWKQLANLLDRHDTRLISIRVLRELAVHDDISRAIKVDSTIVYTLLDMMKSRAEDIGRWTIGVEGLLLLGLF